MHPTTPTRDSSQPPPSKRLYLRHDTLTPEQLEELRLQTRTTASVSSRKSRERRR